MRSLETLRATLAARAPSLLEARRRAAVAVVLHGAPAGPEMLFIERARRLGDPWSGDMAFPGGRVDPTDRDPRAAAEREAHEEVGLDLTAAERLGRLDDLQAGVPLFAPFVLSAFVYHLARHDRLTLNHEVRTALWVPLETLLDPGRHVGRRFVGLRLPGILVGEPDRHVVWGLTYRLLQRFFAAGGVQLPGWL